MRFVVSGAYHEGLLMLVLIDARASMSVNICELVSNIARVGALFRLVLNKGLITIKDGGC